MDRTDIYYWKSDRAAAFHGMSDWLRDQSELKSMLGAALEKRFHGEVRDLALSSGQGNHRTFTAEVKGEKVFIRTEDGKERDNYFAVEAAVTDRVAGLGIPVPRTLAYDCSRQEVPFAWQAIPFIDAKDLNSHFKADELDWTYTAPAIGRAVATWQEITAPGYGPFSASLADSTGELQAFHPTLESYYRLNLDRHLDFLVIGDFFSAKDAERVRSLVDSNTVYLHQSGVLVHKDLALWNILGTPIAVTAFIDWDDTVIGDATDDLSLMGCFHGLDVLAAIIDGYESALPLPDDFAPRFWLSLLRNMLFKAVIRVGAGYFKQDGRFFLITGSGESLEEITRRKIETALTGLEKGYGIDELGK